MDVTKVGLRGSSASSETGKDSDSSHTKQRQRDTTGGAPEPRHTRDTRNLCNALHSFKPAPFQSATCLQTQASRQRQIGTRTGLAAGRAYPMNPGQSIQKPNSISACFRCLGRTCHPRQPAPAQTLNERRFLYCTSSHKQIHILDNP